MGHSQYGICIGGAVMPKLSISQSPIIAQLAQYNQGREKHCETQALAMQRYSSHSASHGFVPPANRPVRIRAYTKKTRSLWTALWAGGILASAVFALLNCLSIEGSPVVIAVGSVIFAVLIGKVAHSTVAGIAKVDTTNPDSVGRANAIRVTGGILALVAVSVFCYLRFSGDSNERTLLPLISMVFELANLLFVAAVVELLGVYSWADEATAEYENADKEIRKLDLKISSCRTQLEKENSANGDIQTNRDAGPDSAIGLDRKASSRGKPNGSSDHSGLR